MAGKTCQEANVLGAISGARHVHLLAKHYGIPVILHTDHAARKLLPWIDSLIEASIFIFLLLLFIYIFLD